MNADNNKRNMPVISRWIYTEAQTGCGRLDTHFSFVNVVLKSFVQDGNDVVLEDDIVNVMSFQGGIAGTTIVLLNCEELPKSSINKKIKR